MKNKKKKKIKNPKVEFNTVLVDQQIDGTWTWKKIKVIANAKNIQAHTILEYCTYDGDKDIRENVYYLNRMSEAKNKLLKKLKRK